MRPAGRTIGQGGETIEEKNFPKTLNLSWQELSRATDENRATDQERYNQELQEFHRFMARLLYRPTAVKPRDSDLTASKPSPTLLLR
jgi:hypothetical protein